MDFTSDSPGLPNLLPLYRRARERHCRHFVPFNILGIVEANELWLSVHRLGPHIFGALNTPSFRPVVEHLLVDIAASEITPDITLDGAEIKVNSYGEKSNFLGILLAHLHFSPVIPYFPLVGTAPQRPGAPTPSGDDASNPNITGSSSSAVQPASGSVPITEAAPSSSGERPESMFENAHSLLISGGSFHAGGTFYVNTSAVSDAKVLEPLHKQVARNAILNAGGRADDVRCHPGTRQELIRVIEQWIFDAQHGLAPRMFWLSGPAGAGKSAIIQTVAERRNDSQQPQLNFFFFRLDSTRSTVRPFFATLVYQITQLYPDTRRAVASALDRDPLLLESSISDQATQLLRPALMAATALSSASHSMLLIIDGLDECETIRSQQQLVSALGGLMTSGDSAPIILLSSRAEPHIETAIRSLEVPVKSVFLDESYSPEVDITLFVTDEFRRIRQSHPLAHLLRDDWPSPVNIRDIVYKSSGQFIYAATVMRFLSGSRASPALSLDKIDGLASIGKASPFSNLDVIYEFILSQVDDWEATRDVLAFHFAIELTISRMGNATNDKQHMRRHTIGFLWMYNHRYSKECRLSCISELSAIAKFDQMSSKLQFYHKSFADFLLAKDRSGAWCVDVDAFVSAFLEHTWGAKDYYWLDVFHSDLILVLEKPSDALTNIFLTRPPPDWMKTASSFRMLLLMEALQKMHDAHTFALIISNYEKYGFAKYIGRHGSERFGYFEERVVNS